MLDETKPLRLRFESHDDALDYAKKLVKDQADWRVFHQFDIAHSYMVGDLDLHIRCASDRLAEKFHFVFRPVPNGKGHSKAGGGNPPRPHPSASRNDDRGDGRVFVGVTEHVKYPEGNIPSFVWLERANEVNDFFREFFQTTPYGVLKVRLRAGNREESVLNFFPGREQDDGVDGLVEGGAEVISGVQSNAGQRDRYGLSELDLMNFLGSVRVNLYDKGVWLCFDELAHLPFEVTDVLLCARKAVL